MRAAAGGLLTQRSLAAWWACSLSLSLTALSLSRAHSLAAVSGGMVVETALLMLRDSAAAVSACAAVDAHGCPRHGGPTRAIGAHQATGGRYSRHCLATQSRGDGSGCSSGGVPAPHLTISWPRMRFSNTGRGGRCGTLHAVPAKGKPRRRLWLPARAVRERKRVSGQRESVRAGCGNTHDFRAAF